MPNFQEPEREKGKENGSPVPLRILSRSCGLEYTIPAYILVARTELSLMAAPRCEVGKSSLL